MGALLDGHRRIFIEVQDRLLLVSDTCLCAQPVPKTLKHLAEIMSHYSVTYFSREMLILIVLK